MHVVVVHANLALRRCVQTSSPFAQQLYARLTGNDAQLFQRLLLEVFQTSKWRVDLVELFCLFIERKDAVVITPACEQAQAVHQTLTDAALEHVAHAGLEDRCAVRPQHLRHVVAGALPVGDVVIGKLCQRQTAEVVDRLEDVRHRATDKR